MQPSISSKPSATWLTPRITPRSSSGAKPARVRGEHGEPIQEQNQIDDSGQHQADLSSGGEGYQDGYRGKAVRRDDGWKGGREKASVKRITPAAMVTAAIEEKGLHDPNGIPDMSPVSIARG